MLLHIVDSSPSSSWLSLSRTSTGSIFHRTVQPIVTASGFFGRPSSSSSSSSSLEDDATAIASTTKFNSNIPGQQHEQQFLQQTEPLGLDGLQHPNRSIHHTSHQNQWNTSSIAVQDNQPTNVMTHSELSSPPPLQQQHQQRPPPPPPPPLPLPGVSSIPPIHNNVAVENHAPLHPPPHPLPQIGQERVNPYNTNKKEESNQAKNENWNRQQLQQQQQQQTNEIQSYQEQLYYLHQDLDLAYQREQQFLSDLHNLTFMTQEAKQRETLHMHQLDVLTERIIQIESKAAHDHNALLEYQNNCTSLLSEMELQKGYVQEWQDKCQSLLENRKIDEEQIQELKKKVKDATREVEALATMIEEHRLNEGDTNSVKQRKEKKQKTFNFWAWLFGWNTEEENDDDLYEKDHQDIYETARSTLLTALQNERNNVNELESTIMTLQQNKSAIEEEIQSRDAVITDLTNRMTSYDEEKLVLKAALRQLQLERNEEAPKQQTLKDELQQTQSEIIRLTKEMDLIVERHNTTVTKLQRTIDDKIATLKAVQHNMTVMGTYVGKLEERLTDFTVARRNIEERELKCKDIETKSKEIQTERDQVQTQVSNLEQEHDELKKLLSELVQERSKLLENITASDTKSTMLEQDVQRLRQSYAMLDNEVRSVRAECLELQTQKDEMEIHWNETISRHTQLERQCEQLMHDNRELQLTLDNASAVSDQSVQQQKGLLEEAVKIQANLERRVIDLEKELEVTRLEHKIYKEEAQAMMIEKEHEIELARTKERQQREVAVEDSETVTAIPVDDWNKANETRVHVTEETRSPNTLHNKTEIPRIAPSTPRRRQFGEVVEQRNKSTNPNIMKPIVQQLQQQQQQQALVPVTKNNVATTGTKRKVPLRQLRKLLARATGIHGLITKPTRQS